MVSKYAEGGQLSTHTVLSERRCTAHDEDGLSGVSILAAFFPERLQAEALRLGVRVEENQSCGAEGSRESSGGLKADVLRNLPYSSRINSVSGAKRTQLLTCAASAAVVIAYCWNVACAFSFMKPWKTL